MHTIDFLLVDILNTEGPDLLGSVLMMEPNILLNAIVERPSLMRVLLDAVNSMNEQGLHLYFHTFFFSLSLSPFLLIVYDIISILHIKLLKQSTRQSLRQSLRQN